MLLKRRTKKPKVTVIAGSNPYFYTVKVQAPTGATSVYEVKARSASIARKRFRDTKISKCTMSFAYTG